MRWMSVLLFLAWAEVGWSAQIPVQTGEHANFTRVVLRVPENAVWDVRRTASGYRVSVDGATDFLTSRAFDLIPRDRITDIFHLEATNSLLLETSCPCFANAFVDAPGILVVDIMDGVPDANSPFEAIVADETATVQTTQTFDVPKSPFLPLLPRAENPAMTQPKISTVQAQPEAEQPILQQSLEEIQASVSASISSALAQGFLESGDQVAGSSVGVSATQKDAPGILLRSGVDPKAGTSKSNQK